MVANWPLILGISASFLAVGNLLYTYFRTRVKGPKFVLVDTKITIYRKLKEEMHDMLKDQLVISNNYIWDICISFMDKKTIYSTVRIDEEILKIIDELLEDQKVMYRSRSEFVHGAVREKIESYFVLFPDLKSDVETSLKKK